jgi:hypothetical protein
LPLSGQSQAGGPVLRALADASGADEQVERAYRGLVQEFIDATAPHIRGAPPQTPLLCEMVVRWTASKSTARHDSMFPSTV